MNADTTTPPAVAVTESWFLDPAIAGRGRHRPGRVVPPVRGLNSNNNQPNEKRRHS